MATNGSIRDTKSDKKIAKLKKLQEKLDEAFRSDTSHSKKLSNNNVNNKT